MDAETRLDGFIDKYDARIAALFRRALAKVKALVPGGVLLVYDNYNALGVGFAAGETSSAVAVSLVAYPRWITLFFLKGAGLPDPHGLLAGTGSTVRSIRLDDQLSQLDDARVHALVAQAVDRCEPPFDATAEQRLVIRAVSDRQAPRRPLERNPRRSRAVSRAHEET